MNDNNTLFYCLGVIVVFLIISICKNGTTNVAKKNNETVAPAPLPEKPQPPTIKNDIPVPDSPPPSQPANNNGSGGLAGAVLNKNRSTGRRMYTN